MTVVAALGDSLTCGEGVGVRVPVHLTWAALLADALPDGHLLPLAVPGARVSDVRRSQLPRASSGGAHVVTVLVGLNDVVRSGYDAPRMRSDLLSTVHQLAGSGTTVLLGRLHDPTAMFPVPGRLRKLVRSRVGVLNDAVDEAAGYPRVHVLDLTQVPVLTTRAGWAVDRVHPSAAGHAAIAAAAVSLVRDVGWATAPLPAATPGTLASSWAQGWWLVTQGTPYLVRHLREFGVPWVTAMARRP